MPFKRPVCLASPDTADDKESSKENDLQIVPVQEVEIPELERGSCRVILHKKEKVGLGLTIAGGKDKDSRPKVSNMRSGGIASMCDRLQVGDYITAVNGIRTSKMKHAEVISLLKNVGETVTLDVEYHLPPITVCTASITQKSVDVILKTENNSSFGFVLRGGFHSDRMKSRSHVVTFIREGSYTDKESVLKAGDRIKFINSKPIHNATLEEAYEVIEKFPDECTFTIEYDVSVMDAVKNASGPLLVEVSKAAGSNLGVVLTVSMHNGKHCICIGGITPASIAERCGALNVGDRILSVDGIALDMSTMSLQDSEDFLKSSSDHIRLEILPVSQALRAIKYPTALSSARSLSALNSSSYMHPHTMSTTSTLYRDGPSSRWARRRNFSRYCSSAVSLASKDYCSSNQVVHAETVEVSLLMADDDVMLGNMHSACFGIQLQGGVFATEVLISPPSIASIESGSPAEKCGLIQSGDRLVSVNGCNTENETLAEVNQMLQDALEIGQVYLVIEFDVAESVVPSCGTFHVKLPKRKNMELGIVINTAGPSKEPLYISEVKQGSVAHRTGILQAGDRLLAVDGMRLDATSTIEDAMALLNCAENVVRLKIKKEDDYSDGEGTNAPVIYTVELKKNGGSLGITIAGNEDIMHPIVISGLIPNGVASKTGAIHKGDQILSINKISLKKKPLSEAVRLLQTAGDTVALKIKKSPHDDSHSSSPGFSYVEEEDIQNYSSEKASSQENLLSPETDRSQGDTPSRNTSSITGGETTDVDYKSVGRIAPAGASSAETSKSWEKSGQDSSLTPDNYMRMEKMFQDTRSEYGAGLRHSETWGPRYNNRFRMRQQQHSNNVYPTNDWQRALEGLQSVGQSSEIMKDLEESIMSTSKLNISDSAVMDTRPHFQQTRSVSMSRMEPQIKQAVPSMLPLGPSVQLFKVTLVKSNKFENFGFSLSDGQLEHGVFVHSTHQGGPAYKAGLRPYDRILQVNGVPTREFDCRQAIPLLTRSGNFIELVIARNPCVSVARHQLPLLAPPIDVPSFLYK